MLATNGKMNSSELLAESFSQTIETMAFMMALPPEEELPVPDESVKVQMSFTGPTSGKIELAAGTEVLINAAANIMGLEPDDPLAREKAIDAFKEILNTTCGILLPRIATSPSDIFDVSIPEEERFDNKRKWTEYVSQPDVVLLEIDYCLVAVKMEISAS